MLEEIWAAIARQAPTITLALVVLSVGVALSVFVGRAAAWLARRAGLERLFAKVGGKDLLEKAGYNGEISDLVGGLARWTGIAVAALVAADIAGLTLVASGLGSLVAFAPRVLVAGATFIVVVWLASVLRSMAVRASTKGDDRVGGHIVGEVIYYAVVAIGFAVGTAQLGIDTRLVNALILVVAGAASVGVALSFAFAARGMLSDVVAQFYARRAYAPGDQLHLLNDDIRGVVVEYRTNLVILETEGDYVWIPCGQLMTQPVRVIPPDVPIPRPAADVDAAEA